MLVVNRESPFDVYSGRPRRANIIVILFNGKIGSGKSTVAQALVDYVNKVLIENPSIAGVRKFSFAKNVKAIAKAIGWDGEKDDFGRKLLQTIGHAGRYYSNGRRWANDTAIDILTGFKESGAEGWRKLFVAVIDDFRYPEEFFVMCDRFKNVYTIKVIPPKPLDIRDDMDTEIMKHPSENSLDSWSLWNAYLYNAKGSNPGYHAKKIFDVFIWPHVDKALGDGYVQEFEGIYEEIE